MSVQFNTIEIRRGCLWGVAGVLGVMLTIASPVAMAQEGDAVEVEFTVTEAKTSGQLITVPVNQGVLVDFNVPVREVHVANPQIADVTPTSPKQILVDGRSYGTTQLTVRVDGGQQRMFTVAVDLDLARLQMSIEQAVPRATVKAQGMLDTVVLTGKVPDIQSAERILQIAEIYSKRVINQVQVAGVQQVMLRVTVAEVNRSATRQLGFNGWMAGDDFPSANFVNNLGGINPVSISGTNGVSATDTIPFVTGSMDLTASPTLAVGFPQVQMQIFIRALRENGLLHVLAEPNVVTVSGEAATFLAGGEFPVPVPDEDGISVEFREFGVRLNFTPTVLGPDTIHLKVAPEVSEPDFTNAVQIAGYVVPGLSSRRVSTTVELGPGQTFAIGGLLSDRTRAVTSRVPALGDLPVLGALFRSVEYQQEESELVVLVTPELVAPLNPDQVGYVAGGKDVPPNDWELFMLGRIHGAGGGADSASAPLGQVSRAVPASTSPPTAMRLRGPIGPAGGSEGM